MLSLVVAANNDLIKARFKMYANFSLLMFVEVKEEVNLGLKSGSRMNGGHFLA